MKENTPYLDGTELFGGIYWMEEHPISLDGVVRWAHGHRCLRRQVL